MSERILKKRGIGALVVPAALAAFVTAALAIMMSACLAAQTAWADVNVYTSGKTMTQTLQKWYKILDLGTSTEPETFGAYTTKKVKNARSTNSKVVAVKVGKGKDKATKKYYMINFTAKKPGKATVSYSVDGKKYKINFTVIKYTNPIGKLTLDGKDYKKQFNKTMDVSVKNLAGKKIVFTPAAGWKVKSASARYTKKDEDGAMIGSSYKVTSGSVLKDGTFDVTIFFTNKKTGITRGITFE